MKVILDIPENVAQAFRDFPEITRKGLEQRCEISEYYSKTYHYLHRYGKVIAYHETRLKPKSGKTMLALVLADLQIPYHDDLAIKTALDWGLSRNPDMVILDGDINDCYKISDWKTDPTRPDFGTEVKICRDELKKIDEKLKKCKSVKEVVYISGNHEERLRRELWGASKKLAGLDVLKIPILYETNELGWKYVDNSQLLREELTPFKLGKLNILHGHEVRVNYSVVNIPRIYYQRCLVNLLVGHHHRTQENIERKLDHSHDGAWSVGCLCKLSQDYAPVNKWNHGFALVEWDSQGDFSISNKKIINGKVL